MGRIEGNGRRVSKRTSRRLRKGVVALLVSSTLLSTRIAFPQQSSQSPTPAPAPRAGSSNSVLAGRTIEDVRILGNTQTSTAVILNLVRTKVGDKLDPATVTEDYQRIYSLRK